VAYWTVTSTGLAAFKRTVNTASCVPLSPSAIDTSSMVSVVGTRTVLLVAIADVGSPAAKRRRLYSPGAAGATKWTTAVVIPSAGGVCVSLRYAHASGADEGAPMLNSPTKSPALPGACSMVAVIVEPAGAIDGLAVTVGGATSARARISTAAKFQRSSVGSTSSSSTLVPAAA